MEQVRNGLSIAELEAQQVELLPDRVEMRRRRHKSFINRWFAAGAVGGLTTGDIKVGNTAVTLSVTFPPVEDNNGTPGEA